MKQIITITFLLLISLVSSAQNEGYNEFRQSRHQQQQEFAQARKAEYEKFKQEYYAAFEKYKKLYTDFINEEIGIIDLMAYDDDLPIEPLEKGVPQPVIITSAKSEKQLLRSNIKALSDLTPEQVLGSLSDETDSLAQMAQAAQVMQQIVTSMESELDQPVAMEEQGMAQQATKVVLESYDPEEYAKRKERIEQENAQFQQQQVQEAEQQEQNAQQSQQTQEEQNEPIFKYTEQGITTNVPSGKPTNYTRISSPFGTRIHPITRRTQTHKGIDMAAPRMTPVYATADGKVTFAKYNGGYGNFVKINHQNGYKTAYAHLHKIAVNNGDDIKKGDLVGYVGTTGRSTGNHLHYEVYYKDQLVDPASTL